MPQVLQNSFLCDKKQETMKIVDFGYLGINFLSLRQYSMYKPQPSRESFSLHKGSKNERAISYLKIVFFLTTPIHTHMRKHKFI